MADPKNSELPRANGKIAPAVWGGEEFVVLQGTKDGKMYVVGNVTMDNLPSEYKVIGTVNIGNLPEIQKVEVTNQKAVQDVSDAQVKAELEQIKQTQSQILERLDGQFDANVSVQGKKAEVETILSSELIEPGNSTGRIEIDTKGCSRIIIALNADVKWALATNSFWSNVINYSHLYPRRFDDQDPAPNTNYPQESVVGLNLNDATSFYDAIRNGFLPANIKINAYNRDSTDGLFTIKIMRLWEV